MPLSQYQYRRRQEFHSYQNQRQQQAFNWNMRQMQTRAFNQCVQSQRSSWQMQQQHSVQAENRRRESSQNDDRMRVEIGKLPSGVNFSGDTKALESMMDSVSGTVTGFFRWGSATLSGACRATGEGCKATAEVFSEIPFFLYTYNERLGAYKNHFWQMKTTFIQEEQEELRALTIKELEVFQLPDYRGELVTVKRSKAGLVKPDICIFKGKQYRSKESVETKSESTLTEENWFQVRERIDESLQSEITRRVAVLNGFKIACKLDFQILLDHFEFLKKNQVEIEKLKVFPRFVEIIKSKPEKIFNGVNLEGFTDGQIEIIDRVNRELVDRFKSYSI